MNWLVVCPLYVVGTLLYMKGLVKKAEPSTEINAELSGEGRYKKAVVVVLDGLRADTLYRTDGSMAVHNSMNLVGSIRQNDMYRAVSICDLPTATTLRIYSTFSGTPSNVCQVKDSFSKIECTVDNFVDQVLGSKRTLAFFGDDTWLHLFPSLQKHSRKSYSAYGKKSIGEEKEIMELALEEVGKHDVLITHLAGYDSMGHFVGMDHPKMREFVVEYDKFVHAIYRKMGNGTVLVVMSDHGTEDSGDHGGVSLRQRASILMVAGRDLCPRERGGTRAYAEYADRLAELGLREEFGVVSQNDILPTLCHLIGIPTPENSVGTYIRELVSESDEKRAYLSMVERKRRVIAKLGGAVPGGAEGTVGEIVLVDERLSEEIISRFKSIGWGWIAGGLLVFFAGLAIHFMHNLHYITFLVAASVVLLFLTAHSMHSTIHEDVFVLFGSAVGLGPCKEAALSALALFIGRFPPHECDRIFPISSIKKLPEFLHSRALFLLLLVPLSLLFFKRLLGQGNGRETFVLLALAKSCAPQKTLHWIVPLLFGMETLPIVLYSPLSFLYVMLVYREAAAKALSLKGSVRRGVALFFLGRVAFFATGHHHSIGSLNWKAAFIFSTRAVPFLSHVFVLLDVMYPLLFCWMSLDEDALGVTLFLQAVETLFSFLVNFWFLGNALFTVFLERSLFASFFLSLLSVLHLVLQMSRHPAALVLKENVRLGSWIALSRLLFLRKRSQKDALAWKV
jgi:GPI ethanolamine phosphate transferase 3 subunit O